ncbi:MAG: hypothetical protein DI551_02570 [Micavibrio aeruginosavorus]|uniref:Uncharacterized protein n=1 Tax=Micavibrio aeruginosavorus TaxID=349221 RepID=A0A2W5NAY3_9BACT|nr:MAG: hypothetical protein DI551_02570 [Micavibrio aeruginosavorus]
MSFEVSPGLSQTLQDVYKRAAEGTLTGNAAVSDLLFALVKESVNESIRNPEMTQTAIKLIIDKLPPEEAYHKTMMIRPLSGYPLREWLTQKALDTIDACTDMSANDRLKAFQDMLKEQEASAKLKSKIYKEAIQAIGELPNHKMFKASMDLAEACEGDSELNKKALIFARSALLKLPYKEVTAAGLDLARKFERNDPMREIALKRSFAAIKYMPESHRFNAAMQHVYESDNEKFKERALMYAHQVIGTVPLKDRAEAFYEIYTEIKDKSRPLAIKCFALSLHNVCHLHDWFRHQMAKGLAKTISETPELQANEELRDKTFKTALDSCVVGVLKETVSFVRDVLEYATTDEQRELGLRYAVLHLPDADPKKLFSEAISLYPVVAGYPDMEDDVLRLAVKGVGFYPLEKRIENYKDIIMLAPESDGIARACNEEIAKTKKALEPPEDAMDIEEFVKRMAALPKPQAPTL